MASSSPAPVLELDTRSNPSRQPSDGSHVDTSIIHDSPRDEESHAAAQLAPADGGFAAWRLLCAAYVFEALLWGYPLSFGVFQEYYSTIPEFHGNRFVSVVGTVASGISYLGAPLVMPVIRRYSKYRRHMIIGGWPICLLGLVAGSFATTLPGLILSQGITYGIGFLIFYYPILSFVDEFWIARRGFAYGLLCSASGVSGTVMPLLNQALLRRYGYPTTLRIIALALLVLTGPLIPFLKGRLPVIERAASPRMDWSPVKKPLFWIYNFSNLLMGLGYFFPALYLPSFATSIGLSTVQGALLLTLMSISQVAGQLTFGYLSDLRVSVDVLLTSSVLVAGIATFSLWGIAQSMALLVVFAIFYGFFGAGYTALWARMVTAISTEPTASQPLFGVFCFGKGIGNIVAGPIGAGLLLNGTDRGSYGALRYKAIVVFTGVCLLLSGLAIGPARLKARH